MKTKMKILVAEDNDVSRRVLQLILEKRDYEVVFAHNGQEAIDLFAASNFDLILMDCQMPILNGIGSTKKIRELEKLAHLKRCPVIAVTANSESITRELCELAGMDDFITKPVKTHELISKVSNWHNWYKEPAS